MRPLVLIIGACLIILLLGAVMNGIRDFRSAAYSELHNVTTVNGTTSSVILTQDLFDDDTGYVTISSNFTGDAPVPSSYTTASQSLLVSGLATSTTRQLTVAYRYGQLSNYWGADLGARTWPTMIVLGVIGLVVGAVYVATKRE